MMHLIKLPDFGLRNPVHNVSRLKVIGMRQSSSCQHIGQRLHRTIMKLAHPLGLVWHHKGAGPPVILRGNAGWARVGMAAL
jgi:hypothetical protein